jgi:RNA polymerase sigma factor (sigma-70 family)
VLTESSDAQLVDRTLAGDTSAYAELVRRYRRAALARALAVLGEQQEAEDVAQESFVQAYDQLGTCRDQSRFGAWLLAIVHRSSLNRARAIKRRRAVPLEPERDRAGDYGVRENDAAEAMDRAELQKELLGALRQLSPVQREVVLLSDLEDWSHAEIAEQTGLSITMSRRHLSDARRKLRALLSSLGSSSREQS